MSEGSSADREHPWWRSRSARAGLGVAVAAAVMLGGPFDGHDPAVGRTAAIATLMALWWVFEVVPLYVTALLPLVLFPLASVDTLPGVAVAYGKPTIFLFLGGFVLALGLQRSGLHRRVALAIVTTVGSQPRRLVLGFMLASALLSMWISNTASVLVLLPIALSVLGEAGEQGVSSDQLGPLATAMMLGIAYAADIGGMATPIGTPPNLVLLELLPRLFPGAPPIDFGAWLVMGLPLSAAFLASGYWLLSRRLLTLGEDPLIEGDDALHRARRALGPVRRDEWYSGGVFAATAVLWMTGAGLQLGSAVSIPGWRDIPGLSGLGDPSVAIAGAVILFLIPSSDRPGEALMDWETTKEVPWGLLLLFGGGFALAGGFEASGLSALIGSAIAALGDLHPVLLVILVCGVLTMLTEVTSNTATTSLVLPILARAGVALGVDPRILMIPATLSASCAFMMPVASPTQAIVFGSGHVTIGQMVRAGIWFNVLGVALVTLCFFGVGLWVFGIEPLVLPPWAH